MWESKYNGLETYSDKRALPARDTVPLDGVGPRILEQDVTVLYSEGRTLS